MAASIPLVVIAGQTQQLPSGYQLGGVTGGTTTGQVMTQDQFGTNSTSMLPSGSPTFSNITVASISSPGILTVTPTSGNDLDVELLDTAGKLHIEARGSSSSGVATVMAATHNLNAGTAAAGMGVSFVQQLESTTTESVVCSADLTTWVDPTHATRTARKVLYVYDTSARECLRMQASGTAAMIGFLGANASAQLVSPDIATALTTFGLASGSPTLAVGSISGFGTGVGTALAVNVGTAGCFVVNGGALGTPSSGTVTNLTGTASININGTVGATTPAAGTFTNLTVNGNTIIGDAAADTVTINAAAWTLATTGGITKTKPADTSTAETLETWKVSDSASTLTISNQTSNVNEFSPLIGATIEAGLNSTALTFSGTKGSADTTNPAVLFLGRYNSGSGNTDIPDGAPLTEFRNRVTTNWQWQMMGSGAIRRPRGTTRETQQLQATITTTDATQTTLATIALTSSYTYIISAIVVARRTGGTSGTADDGASYERRATYTTKGGTVTLMGSVLTIGTDAEDQAGWDVTFTISSTNVLLRVTGAANNNITWFTEYSWSRVNS